MRTLRIIGFVTMFVGIGLKLSDIPGYTLAFIVGAILVVFSRVYPWLNSSRRSPDA